jgi:hypothetical protein
VAIGVVAVRLIGHSMTVFASSEQPRQLVARPGGYPAGRVVGDQAEPAGAPLQRIGARDVLPASSVGNGRSPER